MSDVIESANRSSPQPLASELNSTEGVGLASTLDASSSLNQAYVGARPGTLASAEPKRRISRRRIIAVALVVVGLAAGVWLLLSSLRAGHNQAASGNNPADATQRIKTQTVPLSNLSKQLSSNQKATEASLDVNGSVNVANGLAALTLQGNGAAITNVNASTLQGNAASYYTNASNLASGTVPDARLSPDVALLNGTDNFTGVVRHNGRDICDTSGNCSITTTIINSGGGGSGGGVTASGGIAGAIPVFTGASTLAASLLSESGSTVAIGGSINLAGGSTYQINGAQISSANLADVANLAFLSATQTFTGATNTFKNTSDSVQEFVIQNAAGNNIFTADSLDNRIVLGSDQTATPSGFTISGGAAVGSNIIGGDLVFNASDGTGVGGSGGIIFNTAGGVSNPLVTVDSTNGAGEFPAGNNAPITWSHTVTSTHADTLLIVAVDTQQPTTPSAIPPATAVSVTYNGVALTQLVSLTPNGGEAYGSIWYMASPPAGAHNVTVTFTGPTSDIEVEATSFYNVDTTKPIANYTTNSQHTTNISTTLNGTDAGEGIFDAVMARADWTTPLPGPGQTLLYLQPSSGRNTGSFRQGQAGSTTMSWTAAGPSTLNHVVIALTPEPNLTPDPLTQALNITQIGTLGIDLATNETAQSTISFGGGANRSIVVNQNPGTGGGSNLTLQAGTGAIGNNNGGNLILQGGLATGTGTGGGVIVEPQTDSAAAFQILQSTGTPLLTANTSNLVVTVAGTTTTFGSLSVSNAHFKSTQATAPAIGAASNCGAAPGTAITAGSTDSAGSFTIIAGTGTPTTCDTTLTFTSPYGAAPKSVILSRTTAVGGATTSLNAQVSATSPTSFTIQIAPTSAAASTTYSYYYWVIE